MAFIGYGDSTSRAPHTLVGNLQSMRQTAFRLVLRRLSATVVARMSLSRRTEWS